MIIGLYPIVGDLLHAGHFLAMEEAKNQCDYLIVALNCTPDKKDPVQTIYERFIQLRGVKFVDEIIPYQGKRDLENLCASLNYQIRFIGQDYVGKDWDGKDIELALSKEFIYLNRQHNFSSTELKKRILERE